MSTFNGPFDQLGGNSLVASTQPFDNGSYGAYDSFSNFPDSESLVGESPIYVSGGGFASDQVELSPFSKEANGKPFDGGYVASDGPIFPPMEDMQPEEGYALREWRRQNAVRLEEMEKREKELVNQIIDEANEFKINFLNKRNVTCEANKSSNRKRRRFHQSDGTCCSWPMSCILIFLTGQEKFHAEVDKAYWKAIAELIPNEVPAIVKKRGKKDQDKKPSVVVIQGPKPGKPTDLSRMRQILIKLKNNTPPHLQPSPPAAADPSHVAKADSAVTASVAVA